MSLSIAELDNQEKLKRELHNAQEASKLEHLAAALIESSSRCVDCGCQQVWLSTRRGCWSGWTARATVSGGMQEVQWYTSSLSERELLGGDRPSTRCGMRPLKLGCLVATSSRFRTDPAIACSARRTARRSHVLIIDWVDSEDLEVAPLAALCAFAPDLVEREFSREAGAAACALQPISEQAIERLRREICNLGAWDLKQCGRILTISSTKFGTRRKNRRLQSDKTRLGVLKIRRSNATRCIRP